MGELSVRALEQGDRCLFFLAALQVIQCPLEAVDYALLTATSPNLVNSVEGKRLVVAIVAVLFGQGSVNLVAYFGDLLPAIFEAADFGKLAHYHVDFRQPFQVSESDDF